MIIDSRLKNTYLSEFTQYEILLKKLDQTLLSYTKKKNFAYSSRIKSIESISEKIETGRYEKWDDIDEVV